MIAEGQLSQAAAVDAALIVVGPSSWAAAWDTVASVASALMAAEPQAAAAAAAAAVFGSVAAGARKAVALIAVGPLMADAAAAPD